MNAMKILKSLLGLLLVSASHAPWARELTYTEQGSSWDNAKRKAYYVQDQGSRLIPYPWIKALSNEDGTPFLGDHLQRYGFLADSSVSPTGIIGVTVAQGSLGLSCAACHTREISHSGRSYRIDGGPALINLQPFFLDLDAAVASVLNNEERFSRFAAKALLGGVNDISKSKLRRNVNEWYRKYHALMSGSFPAGSSHGAGIGRIDAIGMIINRVGGLAIAPPPSFILENNFAPIDAPSRFPFLWNVGKQDYTEWFGTSLNGNEWLALHRNQSEVIGTFADYRVTNNGKKITFGERNSTNYPGLLRLEKLVDAIGPPKWPWGIDDSLATRGGEIYQAECGSCHGIIDGEWRSPLAASWATPRQDVLTDSRVYTHELSRTVSTGVLEGGTISATDGTFTIGSLAEATTVLGIITNQTILQSPKLPMLLRATSDYQVTPEVKANMRSALSTDGPYRYESRVMQGIWAAAPYLHNGSVPTLEDLLKPVIMRPLTFKVGGTYDTNKLGLSTDQEGLSTTYNATGCDNRDSGNSNCGHEFGTKLSDEDKKALLEYLKTL